jgi:hypothetical protein
MLQGLRLTSAPLQSIIIQKNETARLQGVSILTWQWYCRVYKLQLQHECTFCKLTLKHSQNDLHFLPHHTLGILLLNINGNF